MTLVAGTTWKAEYGELNERNQFRVGYATSETYDAYFPIAQLGDLISVLTTASGAAVGAFTVGTYLQVRNVTTGFHTELVVEPRSNTFPVQIMRLPVSESADLISTLTSLQGALGEPSDWDGTDRGIRQSELPEYLQPSALKATIDAKAGWAQKYAQDKNRTPAHDTPVITWTNVLTSALSSPVQYRPAICGSGTPASDWDGQSDTNFRFGPGIFETFGGANGDRNVRGMQKPGVTTGAYRWPLIVEFTTTAAQVEVTAEGNATAAQFLLSINGADTSDITVQRPSTVTGTTYTFMLTFANERARTIRLWMSGGLQLYAVRVPTGQSIAKAAAPTLTGVTLGDSFFEGAGNSGDYPNQGTSQFETQATRILRKLGCDATLLANVGGTGFIESGGATTYGGRVATILSIIPSPDIVIVNVSTNDGESPDASALQAAMEGLLDDLAAVPEVYVLACPRVGYEASNAAGLAAATAKGRPFIDVSGIMTGTGTVTAKTGDGSNDFLRMTDGVHPNLVAHRTFAEVAVPLIVAARAAS